MRNKIFISVPSSEIHTRVSYKGRYRLYLTQATMIQGNESVELEVTIGEDQLGQTLCRLSPKSPNFCTSLFFDAPVTLRLCEGIATSCNAPRVKVSLMGCFRHVKTTKFVRYWSAIVTLPHKKIQQHLDVAKTKVKKVAENRCKKSLETSQAIVIERRMYSKGLVIEILQLGKSGRIAQLSDNISLLVQVEKIADDKSDSDERCPAIVMEGTIGCSEFETSLERGCLGNKVFPDINSAFEFSSADVLANHYHAVDMIIQQPVNQVRLTNVAIVRLKRQGKRFEVACYRNKLLNWRDGTETEINDVLHSEVIFHNVSKGLLARDKDLQSCFGTKDQNFVAREILSKGSFQVSTEERDVFLHDIFRNICAFVSERLHTKQTGLPLSIPMIQQTLEKAGFSVNLEMPIKRQGLKAVDLLLRKYPDEIARAHMRLKAMVAPYQQTQTCEFLRNECQVNLDQSYQLENQGHLTLTFLCHPSHCGKLEQFFMHTLSPPGKYQFISFFCSAPEDDSSMQAKELLASAEGIFDRTDSLLLGKKHMKDQSLSESSCCTDTAGHQISQKSESRYTFHCSTCHEGFISRAEFKIHASGERHIHNVKRELKGLSSLNSEEFRELKLDASYGFADLDGDLYGNI